MMFKVGDMVQCTREQLCVGSSGAYGLTQSTNDNLIGQITRIQNGVCKVTPINEPYKTLLAKHYPDGVGLLRHRWKPHNSPIRTSDEFMALIERKFCGQ